MTGLRAWIVALALLCFGAGTAAGLLLSTRLRRPLPESGPFTAYQRDLTQAFDLSPERARLLAAVLASYQRELDAIKDRHMADYMSAMEPALAERGRWYRELIRDKILPPDRRHEFDGPAFASVWTPAR